MSVYVCAERNMTQKNKEKYLIKKNDWKAFVRGLEIN
jgi:hypothetical protein